MCSGTEAGHLSILRDSGFVHVFVPPTRLMGWWLRPPAARHSLYARYPRERHYQRRGPCELLRSSLLCGCFPGYSILLLSTETKSFAVILKISRARVGELFLMHSYWQKMNKV